MAFENPRIPIDAKVSVLYSFIQFFEQRKEDVDDALKLADLLIKTHPDEAKAYAISGDLHNLNEDTEKALELYNQSLEIQKDIFSVWQQVFFILSDNKEYGLLVERTNEAKEYFPNQALLYFFNGLGLQQEDELEKAEKSYNKASKMAVDNPVLKAQCFSNLGDLYNSMEQYSDSDEAFEKALKIEPQNAYVLNNYSYYLSLRNEKLDRAAEMSLLSNQLEPDNPSFQDTYAWILYQKGEYGEALEWQERALASDDSPNATLLEHYGDILYRLNRKNDALKYWKQAAEQGEASEVLLQKITDKSLPD